MKIILVMVGVLAILLAVIAYMIFAPAPVSAALLYVDSGEVFVDVGDGWSAASDGMELEVGNKVKTGIGEAMLILQEGEIVSLTENTEITISSITKSAIHLTQTAGVTWNKVTKLSGISKYSIQTPNTLATVRGTEFVLSVDHLDVLDGVVSFGTVKEPEKLSVGKNKRARQDLIEDIPEADLTKYERFNDRYAKALVKLREHEVKKQVKHNRLVVREAEKRGFDKKKIFDEAKTILNDVDEGRKNEDELYAKVPLPLKPKAERVYDLTKKIKEVKRSQPKIAREDAAVEVSRDQRVTEVQAVKDVKTNSVAKPGLESLERGVRTSKPANEVNDVPRKSVPERRS